MAWSELKADAPPRCLVADFDQWRKRLSRDPWAKLPETKQRLTRQAIAAVGETKRK
jgi:bifunctional non-homologous end joining protein LigD